MKKEKIDFDNKRNNINFLRYILYYIGIGIGSIIFVLILYPLHCILGLKKPSVKKYVKYLKGIFLEGKSMPTIMKPKFSFGDKSAKIRYMSYYKKWAKNGDFDFNTSLFYITSNNYENIIKTANIPESVKEEIKCIIEDGDGVLISEAAFKPDWKYPEKYVVIESFDKKPPKVKYMCSIFRGFPDMNFVQRRKFSSYYNKYKYNSMKKPLLLYPVVWVSKGNKEELLQELDIPKEVKDKIEDLVNNDKIVIITEAAFQPEWKWEEKYLVFDKKKN